MANTIAYATKKRAYKKLLIIWLAISAVIAALAAIFFAKDIVSVLAPYMSAEEAAAALAGVMPEIKIAFFLAAALVLPFIYSYLVVFAISFSGEQEWKILRRNILICCAAFYVMMAIAVLMPPIITDTLVAWDNAESAFNKQLYYRLNVILGLSIAACLLPNGIFHILRRRNNEEIFKRIRTANGLLTATAGIIVGFYLPLFMMILIYLPAYACLGIGRLMGHSTARKQEIRYIKHRDSEPVIPIQDLDYNVRVIGAVAVPDAYETNNYTSIADLLNMAGIIDGEEPVFAVVGGESGIMVEKIRFGQHLSTFKAEASVVEFFSAFSCPVAIAADYTAKTFARYGNIGNLAKVKKELTAIAEGKSSMKAAQFTQFMQDEMKRADTPSRKVALRLAESLLHSFPNVVEDHCNNHYCPASVCKAYFGKPCVNACPAHMDMHEIFKIADKDAAAAYAEAVAVNPFAFTSCIACEERNCSAVCKKTGGSGMDIDAVLDKLLPGMRADVKKNMPTANGKKVAIIGAGACGLAAGAMLRDKGYSVKLFEKAAAPGGTLGLLQLLKPQYKDIIEQEKKAAVKGLDIECNKIMGTDFKLTDIRKEYDAVLVSIGADKAKSLFFVGEDLAVKAENFLRDKDGYELKGKRVFMIGSNATALNCAEYLLQEGVESVKIIPSAIADNTSVWNKIMAQDDRISIFSEKWKVNTVKRDEEGIYHVVLRKGFSAAAAAENIDADIFINSYDYSCDAALLSISGLTAGGTGVKINRFTCATDNTGVFAAGACTKNPLPFNVVIAEGIKAAAGIDAYLNPQKVKTAKAKDGCVGCSFKK